MMERSRRNPAVEHMFTRGTKRSQRPNPPESAARAIVDGIERRKTRVWVPRDVGPLLLFRGFVHLIEDRMARRVDLPGAVKIAEAEARERESTAH
jgi:hypothetical protein